MHKLLLWLTKNRPIRFIDVQGRPYLQRYHIALFFGIHVYLHRFVSADGDRSLHDHPWPALSLILCGKYREDRMLHLDARKGPVCVTKTYSAPALNLLRANDAHQITFVRPNTWTLFISFHRRKEWGFYSHDKQNSLVIYSQPYAVEKTHKWWVSAPLAHQVER